MKHEQPWMVVYKQELYTINNLIRLVIVASSISFFLLITCLELSQVLVTALYSAGHKLKVKSLF